MRRVPRAPVSLGEMMNGASEMRQPEARGDDAIMSSRLAALGAETPTQRQVKSIVPWFISLLAHLMIGLAALFITWTVSRMPQDKDAVLIVADFNALTYEPVARMSPEQAPQAPAAVKDLAPVPPLEQTISEVLADSADALPSIAPGASSSAAAELAQLAPRAQTNVSFAGLASSNARRIVYVIDASGSMIPYRRTVIDELARSLSNLSPQQSFSVIFFQDNAAIEMPPTRTLLAATAENKRKAVDWIEEALVARGHTNPLAAIEPAIKMQPDVIFLLSQDIRGVGKFELDQRDLLNALDRMNPRDRATRRRPVQINCIQFVRADPLGTMEAIAREHGGPNGYKLLTEQELGLTPR